MITEAGDYVSSVGIGSEGHGIVGGKGAVASLLLAGDITLGRDDTFDNKGHKR